MGLAVTQPKARGNNSPYPTAVPLGLLGSKPPKGMALFQAAQGSLSSLGKGAKVPGPGPTHPSSHLSAHKPTHGALPAISPLQKPSSLPSTCTFQILTPAKLCWHVLSWLAMIPRAERSICALPHKKEVSVFDLLLSSNFRDKRTLFRELHEM